MLFIISSNNKEPQDNNSGSLLEATQTGITQENLDSLIEKIDVEEEDTTSEEDTDISEDTTSDEVSMEDEKE